MRKLSDTIARLAAMHGPEGQEAFGGQERLVDLNDFGSNPGNLRARIHYPESLSEPAPLVVVLHGCTQSAAGYDTGSGWSRLADEHGFVLLFAEQRRANNPNLCFNWFQPEDNRRDRGEALSIRQMIGALIGNGGIDPARVFITGLSAGGAMTSVMLATYPELFAGGAIIAGLPYGCAATVSQALDRMRGHGGPDAARLGALVRGASDHAGPWPTVSIWHGSGDATVNPSNAEAIIAQWRSLHEVAVAPSAVEIVDGYPRRVWHDANRRAVIEEYSITGMGHGTPLATRGGDGCGVVGPYMLEASISSTRRIADFWGLSQTPAGGASTERTMPADARHGMEQSVAAGAAPPPHVSSPQGVGRIIEDALRAAGLMR